MTQDKRNKIVFVHEQVKMNFLDRKVYEKKLRKSNNGSMNGITFLFHWTLEIAGTRLKNRNAA